MNLSRKDLTRPASLPVTPAASDSQEECGAGQNTSSHVRLPLVYIAGPYTNPDPVENTRNAIKAGMQVYDSGRGVPLIPHLSLLAHIVDPRPVDYWYELDLGQLNHCSAIWRIPGPSTGADKEVAHADTMGIPLFTTWASLRAWMGAQG